jgi:hypothetical protein
MTRTIATLIASTALIACSSDPQAMADASTVTVAHATSLPQSYDEPAPDARDFVFSELAGAPTAPEAFVPESYAPEAYEAPAPSPRVAVRASTCDIIVRRTPNGVSLKAVANLSRPTAGDYTFVITKSGGGGSSDINQGGPLESYAGRHDLGSSEISMGRGASYRATLKLISPSGREICRRVVRS